MREGELVGVVADDVLAFFGVEDDVGAAELGAVVLEGRDREGAGGHEAMALGEVGGGDAVDLQRHDGGAGLVMQDAEDGLQGADPAQGAGAPAHGFGPGEASDGGFQRLGDDLGGGASGALHHREEDVALLVGADFELIAGQAGGAQEALQRLFGGVGAGAFAFFALGFGFGGQPLHRQGETAGRREGGGGGVGQARVRQSVGHEAAQVVGGLGLHAGRDLLRQEFDEEVWHGTVRQM